MTQDDPDAPLRLCVVQLDCLPRACTTRHNLWIPGEPLVDLHDLSGDSEALPSLSAGRLFLPHMEKIHRSIEDKSIKAATEHLKEILSFLDRYKVDVVVFPEYLTPADCLPDLVRFSRGRIVVAGLEHVRNRTLARKLAHSAVTVTEPDMLLQRNVSALVSDERVSLITKKHGSSGEAAAEGAGPIVERVKLRNREFRVGVAVCMDYLRLEEEFRKQRVDIVCIPAYSRILEPFRPDEARDYARLLANCAFHGGSQIMIPGLQGSLVNELGTDPIRAGFEAIVIVDYDGQPQRPSGLRSQSNRLRLRAEIVERTESNSGAMIAIEDLPDLPEETEPGMASLVQRLTGLLRGMRKGGPLAEAFAAYRDALARDLEDPRLRELAANHLVVAAGKRSTAVRIEQARYVLQQLKNGNELAEDAPVGTGIDAYGILVGQLSRSMEAPPGGDVLPSAPVADELSHMGDSASATGTAADAESPAPAQASGTAEDDQSAQVVDIRPYHACERLVLDAARLLDGVRGLPTASPIDDYSAMAQRCRYRAAHVAEWLTELTNLTARRRDYDWNNALSAAARHLGTLRQGLRSDARGHRRTLLVDAAQDLQKVTIRLRELVR